MTKTWCDKCEQLVEIGPTGEPILHQPRNRYWLVLEHVDKNGERCEQSGEKV